MPLSFSVNSFHFSQCLEEEDSTWTFGENGCLGFEALALITFSTPTTCENYLQGHDRIGNVTACEIYIDFKMDQP